MSGRDLKSGGMNDRGSGSSQPLSRRPLFAAPRLPAVPRPRLSCQPWVIVLAAGEGARLRPLTRALYGLDLPKQFCPLLASTSLLGATLERALEQAPAERIVVVVAEEREALARAELQRSAPRAQLVLQPRNIGTGPGILLPLSQIVARQPLASVVIMPSDHYVRDPAPFAATLRRGLARARSSDSVLLVGAVAEAPDAGYGWIEAAAGEGRADGATPGPSRIQRFSEKPSPERAQELFQVGALWNTFIMVGPARRFWQLGLRHLPEQTRRLGDYARRVLPASGLRRLYTELGPGDFSQDVLQHAQGLELLPLEPCGWSDWGTPERVLASLWGTPRYLQLTQRLRAAGFVRSYPAAPMQQSSTS